MAGTIIVDRIESDASYASTINVAGQITFSNTVNFGAFAGTAPVAGFYLPTTNNLAFTTASTERMRIDSSGNVGIGTASPGDKLQVGSGNSSVKIGANGANNFQIYNGALTQDGTNYAFAQNNTGLNTAINAASGGQILLQIASTTKATFDSSGNLGLGVTPSAWNSGFKALEIKNSAGFLCDGDTAFVTNNCYYNTSNSWIYKATDFATRYQQQSGTNKWFTAASGTAGNAITFTQAMTLDSSGRLLLGTTSAINTETGLGVVNSTSAAPVVAFRNSRNTSGDVCLNLLVGSNCQNTSSYLLQGGVSGVANVIYIFGNGNVVNTNNSYGALSDVKLKENIVDATPKLADLMQVKVRSYNLIGSTTKQLGVIAQELETVFPAMVDESPDRDAENNVLETTSKSVKYSVFVPMLIKAMQEQQSLIQSLTARITALEGT